MYILWPQSYSFAAVLLSLAAVLFSLAAVLLSLAAVLLSCCGPALSCCGPVLSCCGPALLLRSCSLLLRSCSLLLRSCSLLLRSCSLLLRSCSDALLSWRQEAPTIFQRTRSQLPLNDTSLCELESNFIAPDITPDMYETFNEDPDWGDFLLKLGRDHSKCMRHSTRTQTGATSSSNWAGTTVSVRDIRFRVDYGKMYLF